MSNTEDTFDESGSDGEESKSKAYEQLLSNPSYFSSAMKVGTAFQFFFPFVQHAFDNYSALCSRA